MLRNRGHTAGALEAYVRLRRLGSVLVEDQPAELIARQGRCRIFEKTGDSARLREETVELVRALYAGGAPIDRPGAVRQAREGLRDMTMPAARASRGRGTCETR
ncbi:MAG TPA: hypothetical protein VKB88_37925 [Bryobacteraceae bacterium]|nr:hypothetical protein [Bryobacteraceae bacterium]